jgi:hypothetical protein
VRELLNSWRNPRLRLALTAIVAFSLVLTVFVTQSSAGQCYPTCLQGCIQQNGICHAACGPNNEACDQACDAAYQACQQNCEDICAP